MVGARLVSNGLIYSPVGIQLLLLTLLLLSNVSELGTGAKTKKKLITIMAYKFVLPNKKP